MTTQSVQQGDSFGARVACGLGSQSWSINEKWKLLGEAQRTSIPWKAGETQPLGPAPQDGGRARLSSSQVLQLLV